MKKSLFILLLLCSSLHLLSNTYIYNPPISLISVDDCTMEDWDKVPTEYLVKLKQEGETMMGGLDSIWVYADMAYLNLLVWYRNDSLITKELVPFNVFLNADGDNKTGGYDDWFLDGNAEWMLEGFLFDSNQPCRYNPAVYMWWGAMGGGITDQTTKTGWFWTDPKTCHSPEDGWGATIPTGTQNVAYSQPLNGNKAFEIQINRSLITDNWASTFSVGFHILRVCADPNAPWEMFGVLPNPTYDEGGAKVTAMKAKVSIDTTQLANISLTATAEDGTITGNVLKDSTIQLNVVPNDGYTFTQWSDGNKDNPRTIVLTQDTILTAIMNKICQGQCGENLY